MDAEKIDFAYLDYRRMRLAFDCCGFHNNNYLIITSQLHGGFFRNLWVMLAF